MFEAMNEFGVDTLKAARALEEAGFETRQAETLVTVFRGFAVGDAATRSQLRDFEQGMKTEIEGLRSEMKTEIAGLRSEMKTEIEGLRVEMKTEIAGLKTRMYQLMLGQTVLIVGLIVSLDRLL